MAEIEQVKRILERLPNVIGRLGGIINLYQMSDETKEQIKKAAIELQEIRKDLIRVGVMSKTLYDNPRLGRKRK